MVSLKTSSSLRTRWHRASPASSSRRFVKPRLSVRGASGPTASMLITFIYGPCLTLSPRCLRMRTRRYPWLIKAVEVEPDYAVAHAIIAFCHEQRYLRGGMREETRLAALHHARLAIAGGGDEATALATAGFIIAVCGCDYETAVNAFDRSFALSSSLALALGFSSVVRAWKGDDAMAVEQANRALRLSPFDPLLYLPYVG